jgi:hypothetical protein
MNNSIKLAKFTLALHEVQERINNEIIPVGLNLQCPDDELLQILDLAAMNIDAYLRAYRLESVPVKAGK